MTTNDERRIKILEFVSERQKKKQDTTKNDVIEYMKGKKLSARQTTHNLIKELKNEGKLNVKEINSQIHLLTVSEKWDIYKMQEELLKSQIKKTLESFPDYTVMIEGKPVGGAMVAHSKMFRLKRKQKKAKSV